MKTLILKTKSFAKLSFLMIAVSAITMTGCDKDDENPGAALVGTWESSYEDEDGSVEETLIFNANGTGTNSSVTTSDGTEFEFEIDFTYTATATTIKITFGGISDEAPYSISGNTLTINGGTEDETVYTRK